MSPELIPMLIPFVCAFYLYLFPLILIHELGHALVAKALRFRVFSITLGYGRQLIEVKPFGFPIRLNVFPVYGLTLAIPQSSAWPRLRFWLFVLGGPATHIGFVLIYFFGFWPRQNLVPPIERHLVATFVIANLFLLLSSLIPRKTKALGPVVGTDGYHLVTIPFADPDAFAKLTELIPRIEVHELVKKGDFAEAATRLERLLAHQPQDVLLKHDLAVCSLDQGDYQKALEIFKEVLSSPEFDGPEPQLLVKNNIAYSIAVLDVSEELAQADRYSAEALLARPKVAAFMGTRGAVLVRLNRLEDGLTLLHRAYQRHSDRPARAANACFIAIAEARRMNFVKASEWLRTARREFGGSHLISYAEREIAPRPAVNSLNPDADQ